MGVLAGVAGVWVAAGWLADPGLVGVWWGWWLVGGGGVLSGLVGFGLGFRTRGLGLGLGARGVRALA